MPKSVVFTSVLPKMREVGGGIGHMNYRLALRRFRVSLQSDLLLISALWLLGIIAGICLADVYAYNSGGVMRLLIAESVSPIIMLLVAVIPVLLIAIFLRYAALAACYLLVIAEAVCRGFCGILIFLTFGSSAWLVRTLFLFSSICVSVLMWWLILRYRNTNRNCFKKDVFISILSAFAVTAVDIFYVSPFLLELTKYI